MGNPPLLQNFPRQTMVVFPNVLVSLGAARFTPRPRIPAVKMQQVGQVLFTLGTSWHLRWEIGPEIIGWIKRPSPRWTNVTVEVVYLGLEGEPTSLISVEVVSLSHKQSRINFHFYLWKNHPFTANSRVHLDQTLGNNSYIPVAFAGKCLVIL
jgi:hypothetical protein